MPQFLRHCRGAVMNLGFTVYGGLQTVLKFPTLPSSFLTFLPLRGNERAVHPPQSQFSSSLQASFLGHCGDQRPRGGGGSSHPIHFSTAGWYVWSLDLTYRCRILRDSSRRESVMSHRNSKPHPNGAATALPFESLNVDSGSSLSGG